MDTNPRAIQAWAELGLSVKARSMTLAPMAGSPPKCESVQPAIQSASGSSLPASIAPFARRTASAISASPTGARRCARWCIRQDPIIAAGAKDGSIANDIFELQDEVASRVAGAIEPRLRAAEMESARRKPTESLDAYDLHLRALAEFRKWTLEGWSEAIGLLGRALAIDPCYASAAGLFGWCRVLQLTNQATASHFEEDLAEGVRFARWAIEAGNEDPDALWMGGWTVLTLGGDRAAGLSAIEHSLALNPNSALAWSFFGWAQAFHNRSAPAIEALERAMRLSPLDPLRWAFFGGLAHAHLAAGRLEAAIEWADRALYAQPRMPAVLAVKAAACAHLGRGADASACIKRLRELRPGATIGGFRAMFGTTLSPDFLADWVEGLRKAGLP